MARVVRFLSKIWDKQRLTTEESVTIKEFARFLLDDSADFPGSGKLEALLRTRLGAAGFDSDPSNKGSTPGHDRATIIDNDDKTDEATKSDKLTFAASTLGDEIPHDRSKPEDVQSTSDDHQNVIATPNIGASTDYSPESTTPSFATWAPESISTSSGPSFFEDHAFDGPFVFNNFSPPFTHRRSNAFSGARITGDATVIINGRPFNANSDLTSTSGLNNHHSFGVYSNTYAQGMFR